ncbi:MAG: hypothetical protein JST24_01045 [Acidobacteria bacterium]|nr:hypothetical protein [Acidobacteriota bacterium]
MGCPIEPENNAEPGAGFAGSLHRLVAPVTAQAKVLLWPDEIEAGLAVKLVKV